MTTRTALVLGGSMAGLCAARVLAEHVDRVVVLDRDRLDGSAGPRAGVPQARHPHALLVRGRRELETLFPGFDDCLRAQGALELDFLRDFASLRPNGWWPPVPSGVCTMFASRTLIESTVRALLAAHPRVELRDRTEVTALVGTGDRRRVTGARVVERDGDAAEVLDADLVVDATGRAARSADWLRALGVTPPAETVVDAHAGYATRWYQAPPRAERPAEWWWHGVWIDPVDLPRDRAGVLMPVEGERWIVTVGGLAGNYPPHDEDGFAAALRDLRSPLIAQAVARATPLSPVYGHREMANRFRQYERWSSPPQGFVALGDAVCRFNPIYGQGMTSAVLSARLLGRCVARHGVIAPALPGAFFRAQARLLADPWSMATGADFRVPGVDGKRPPLAGVVSLYMDALFDAVGDDVTLRRRLGEVIHMLRPARALFAPRVVAAVLRHRLARRARRPSGGGGGAPIPARPAA